MTTISKVAELAGVSRTTVSHVINHADRVSLPLRERVEAAIAQLGYVPNPQAQSLRTGRTNLVAMFIPDIRNPFYPELVRTAQIEFEAAGLDLLIFNADVPGGHSQEHVRDYLRQLRNRRVDGLIIGDFSLHGMHDALFDLDMPTVFVGDLPNNAVDSVAIDDRDGGHQMGLYLARAGHRRVAHITGPAEFAEAMARAEGFESGLRAGGADCRSILRYEGTYLAPSGADAIDWLLANHSDAMPTAIFVANHLMAMGASAALHDRGIAIPRDISFAIFGDQPQLDYARPRLTRVGVSPSLIAERASAMLLDRMAGFDGPPRREALACTLKVFDSA
ncbi:LacI family DNA-binding transcriptional regulator [Aureimonas sp. OT7]|uniref:LacI family DNA-binding transcriptional regulator n=1 Tax=Aureimonas TaxID=414371 RepID=UPI0017848FE5|nr:MULTISPECIES: LacI family DNA-binding transcriptional regulator [Aureimonas]QOG05742.1 LacI family DNA-binding transcriptional regulator [Aureimonas sp. OT7]